MEDLVSIQTPILATVITLVVFVGLFMAIHKVEDMQPLLMTRVTTGGASYGASGE